MELRITFRHVPEATTRHTKDPGEVRSFFEDRLGRAGRHLPPDAVVHVVVDEGGARPSVELTVHASRAEAVSKVERPNVMDAAQEALDRVMHQLDRKREILKVARKGKGVRRAARA